MAFKYWVGGGGNTNDTAHWATSSGGAGSTGTPTSSDEIIVDSNSGSGTMTINAALACRSFRATGSSISVTHNASTTVSIGDGTMPTGDIALDFTGLAGYTKQNSVTATISFISSVAPSLSTVHTINSGGFSLGSINMFNSVNPAYVLVSDLSMTGYFTMGSGFNGAIFGTNGFNISAHRFSFGFGATINTGDTWTINETAAATVWNMGGTDFTTWNDLGSTIEMGSTSSNTRIFAGGGKSYNLVKFVNSGSTGIITLQNSNTFNRLQFQDASNARTLRLTAGTTQTINDYHAGDIQGGSSRLISIDTTTGGSSATIHSLKPLDTDYVSIKDNVATGFVPFYAGANSTDVSGNTGWVFTPRPTSGMLLFMN